MINEHVFHKKANIASILSISAQQLKCTVELKCSFKKFFFTVERHLFYLSDYVTLNFFRLAIVKKKKKKGMVKYIIVFQYWITYASGYFWSAFRYYCVQICILCNYIFKRIWRSRMDNIFWWCKSVPLMNISHYVLLQKFSHERLINSLHNWNRWNWWIPNYN